MNKIKLVIDLIMTFLMIILMKTDVTGLKMHEMIGILIFLLFLIHKLLNFKFIKTIGKNIFNKNLKLNSKIMFWLDIILLIFMLINVFSGILISKFIFKFISINNYELINVIHKSFAWLTLIFISVHIGFHLDRLVIFLTKKFEFLKFKLVKIVLLVLYIFVATFGINSLCKYSIYSKIIPFLNVDNKNDDYKDKNYNKQYSKEGSNDVVNSDENIPTLDEYLSQFYCDGCRKQCSLQNPKCERGKRLREEKIKEYYEIYGNQENQDNNNTTRSDENKDRKYKNKSNVIDVIYIVILFAGGTYYLSYKKN